MAEVFAPPSKFKVPNISTFINKEGGYKFDRDGYEKACNEYREAIKAFVLQRKKGDYIGETLSIQHADSHAEYIIASLKPVQLVHIPLGDAWDSEHARLQTAKSLKEYVDRTKAFNKIWTEAKEKQGKQ